MNKTDIDSERLAQIRTQSEMWIALRPEAKDWDTAFLLSKIDELKKANKKEAFGR